jgi:7-cyano-7-deazaguanine synthase
MRSKAIVLFSGGVDSTTTLAIALHQKLEPVALSFDYGQRHHHELKAAERTLLQFPGTRHLLFRLDLGSIGGSALTSAIDVPKLRPLDQSIPITYVPGRNLIFLSIAAALGETLHAFDLFYGANALDYSGYPDCRLPFIESLEATINLGTRAGVEGRRFRIHAPLLKMTKAEIVRKGIELGVDFATTHSCYDPDPNGRACGRCDSCRIRRKGFEEAGVPDPTQYIQGEA